MQPSSHPAELVAAGTPCREIQLIGLVKAFSADDIEADLEPRPPTLGDEIDGVRKGLEIRDRNGFGLGAA